MFNTCQNSHRESQNMMIFDDAWPAIVGSYHSDSCQCQAFHFLCALNDLAQCPLMGIGDPRSSSSTLLKWSFTLTGTRTGEVFTFQAIEPIPSAILCWTYGPLTYPNIKTTSMHLWTWFWTHTLPVWIPSVLHYFAHSSVQLVVTKGHALIHCATGVCFHFSILKLSKCFAVAAFSSRDSLVASCSPQKPPASQLTTFDSPFARLQRLRLVHQEPKQLHQWPCHKGCYNTNRQNITVVVCGNQE